MLFEREDRIRAKDTAIKEGRRRRIELSAEIESLDHEIADLKRQIADSIANADDLNPRPKSSRPHLKRHHDLLDREETQIPSNEGWSNFQASASRSQYAPTAECKRRRV
ncbi:hypothetical protein BDR22DRAFT_959433, partial [Usnea florida]